MQNLRKSPFWLRILNKFWQGSYFPGTQIRLEKDPLIAAARKSTGLTNFGREFNVEPLERLLWSMEHEARLSPVGRFISRERLVSLLSIRLRAEEYFRKKNGIIEQAVYPAWFIVGLQRTGTTKLQRLLAQDPDHRVIPSWEVINPIPLNAKLYDLNQNDSGNRKTAYPHPADTRIAKARTAITSLKYMSPGFFAVHPIDIMQPEEDILLLDVSFMSTTPEAMMHVPTYASWLEQTDQSEAYAYAVKLLKFLQWIRPARRWVLKSPHHLEFSDLIEKYFSNVNFLWPHRDLAESVPSFLSMVTYNRMIFSDHINMKEITDHWVRKIGYMLDKALQYRNKPGNDAKFTDISYYDLIRDARKELHKVYALNGGLTPELIHAFQQHEAANPHRKHGIHHYSLDDFNLTRSDIGSRTRNYSDFINARYDFGKTT